MLKVVAGLAAAIAVAGAVQAQETPLQDPPRENSVQQDVSQQDVSHERLSQADLNALTDARIGMARAMLQLTPEQENFWPPVEEAIRNDAEVRYRRIARTRAMSDRESDGAAEDGAVEREPDPVAVVRSRGDALIEQGDRLRKLAEALQPLCQTLTPEQKDRMRLAMSHILGETRGEDHGLLRGRTGDAEEEEGDEK